MTPRERAKWLRKNMTDAEKHLWKRLTSAQLGFSFCRQEDIGKYVVDFVCYEKALIVEADGSQHLDSESDRVRDAWLKGEGFRVLRFWNSDILQNTEGVLETIYRALKD